MKAPLPNVVGGTATQQLLARVRHLAQTDGRVLITGESGVGKELVAAYLHAASKRASGPFVTVNCAGLSETLLESELFGHVKGSFTGAYRDKPGKFELAHGGTLFLDEVGEMSPRMQGMLLRVLATGEVQRVGSDHATIGINCRVVSATNRRLGEMVDENLFREDLFYRLNVLHVDVPPLRQRPEDIPLLIDFMLAQLRGAATENLQLDAETHARFCRYHWPGNVRQLENVIQRVVMDPTRPLGITDLPGEEPMPADERSASSLRERRQGAAKLIYEQIRKGASFWDVAYEPYNRHDITRGDLRELVRLALTDAKGNYRSMLSLINVGRSDYKRVVSFLRRHDCQLPFRDFR